MRKYILATTSVLALSGAGTAEASCHSFACVNRQVTSLQHQVSSLQGQLRKANQAIATVVGCFGEAPVTQYGDDTAGYVYSDPSQALFTTGALDETQSGDAVSAWLLFDSCNSTANANAARPVGTFHSARELFNPIAPMFRLQSVKR